MSATNFYVNFWPESNLHLCFFNFFFTNLNFHLFWIFLFQKMNTNYSFLVAVTLGSFPVLYFFTFLYYTDVGSTFFTLLMYLLHLKQWSTLAALTGIVAVIFRQTNIVWVAFMAGISVQQAILQWMAIQKKNVKSQRKQDLVLLQTFFNLLYTNAKRNRKAVWNLFCPYLPKPGATLLLVRFSYYLYILMMVLLLVTEHTTKLHWIFLRFFTFWWFLHSLPVPILFP